MTISLKSLLTPTATINNLGGSNEITASTNTLLSSAQLQQITATQVGLIFTIPNATTLLTGGPTYVIRNAGTVAFQVATSTNAQLFPTVQPNETLLLWLVNNSTADGVWAHNKLINTYTPSISNGSPTATTVAPSVLSKKHVVVSLTPSSALLIYYDGSTNIQVIAKLLTVSGTTLSVGPPTILETNNSIIMTSELIATALSDTTVIIAYKDSSFYKGRVISIAGTNITSTSFTYGAASANSSLTKLSSTKALIVEYGNAIDGTAHVIDVTSGIANVSSSTIWAAGLYSVNVAACCTLDPTVVMMAWSHQFAQSGQATTANHVAKLTISGNSVSMATPVVLPFNQTSIAITKLDTARALYCYGNNVQVVYVSGSTLGTGSPIQYSLGNVADYEVALTSISDTLSVISYVNADSLNYGMSCTIQTNGSAVTAGTPMVFKSNNINTVSSSMLNANKIITSYINTVSLVPEAVILMIG